MRRDPGSRPIDGKPVPVDPNEPAQANSGCGSALRQQRLQFARQRRRLVGEQRITALLVLELLVLAAADHAAVRSRAHIEIGIGRFPDQRQRTCGEAALRPGGDRIGRDDRMAVGRNLGQQLIAGRQHQMAADDHRAGAGADGDLLAGFAEIGGIGRAVETGAAPHGEREQPGCQLDRIKRQVAAAQQRARPFEAELRGKCAGRQVSRPQPRLAALLPLALQRRRPQQIAGQIERRLDLGVAVDPQLGDARRRDWRAPAATGARPAVRGPGRSWR